MEEKNQVLIMYTICLHDILNCFVPDLLRYDNLDYLFFIIMKVGTFNAFVGK